MKIRFASLVILLVIIFATPLIAADNEVGRYQAISIPGQGSRAIAILILDTKEGHIWMFVSVGANKNLMQTILYQGKVKPGQKMGDVIDERSVTTD